MRLMKIITLMRKKQYKSLKITLKDYSKNTKLRQIEKPKVLENP